MVEQNRTFESNTHPATAEMLDAITSAQYRSASEVSHPGRELARRIASGEKIPSEDIDKVLGAAGVKYSELSATPEMQISDDIPESEAVQAPKPLSNEEILAKMHSTPDWGIDRSQPRGDREL